MLSHDLVMVSTHVPVHAGLIESCLSLPYQLHERLGDIRGVNYKVQNMLDCRMSKMNLIESPSDRVQCPSEGHNQKESRLEDLCPDYTYRNFCWTIVEKSGTARDVVSAAESSHIPL